MRCLYFKFLILIIVTFFTISATPFKYYYLTTSDGVKIRVGRYCGPNAKTHNTNVLLVLPGLVSRIERQEFLATFYASSGFDVWVLDFRGQGESQRLVENKQMAHVNDFSDYIRDVEALMQMDIIRNKRMSLHGHSMGGQIALQVLCKYPHKFELAMLEAPMIQIKTSFPFFLAEPLAYIFKNWLGKGKEYCLSNGDYNQTKESFEHNTSCRDKDFFNQYRYIPESQKEMIPRKPSWGWAYTALRTTREFLNNLNPLKKVTTKVFLASAGDDKTVDTKYDTLIVSTLPKASHRVYQNAWHWLLHDTPATRKSYLADISTFLKASEKFTENNANKKSEL